MTSKLSRRHVSMHKCPKLDQMSLIGVVNCFGFYWQKTFQPLKMLFFAKSIIGAIIRVSYLLILINYLSFLIKMILPEKTKKYIVLGFFQILWKCRCHILVTLPSYLKNLHSIQRFWLEKLNCGIFHSWKTTTN